MSAILADRRSVVNNQRHQLASERRAQLDPGLDWGGTCGIWKEAVRDAGHHGEKRMLSCAHDRLQRAGIDLAQL